MDGSGSRAGGLEGLIKTVVIHSVLQWFMSTVGTNLAHGLWKSVELRTCKQVIVCCTMLEATTQICFTEGTLNASLFSCTHHEHY